MKNTSIFIPLLLIACLVALIYLAFAALRAAEENTPNGPDQITLNPEDYQDTDAGETLNLNEADDASAGEEEEGDFLEEVPQEERDEEDARTSPSAGINSGSPAVATATENQTQTATAPAPSANGRYLVIAGSFRQNSGAQERVAALRAAGFNNARLERFNRGTFAVALAGQYDRYRNAKTLADQIATRGFEVRVMKRR